jgi:hypothetical protein
MKNEPQENVSLAVPERRRIDWGLVGTWIFWLAVIGGGAWYLTHYFLTQAREHHIAEIRQQQKDASIVALALKYNAVTNWEASLPDRGAGEQPFSIDVARALIGSNQQPVLIECNLDDIVEKDGKIIAGLSSVDTVNSLSLKLECSPGQLTIFTGTNQLLSFVVVARCHEVQRLPGDDEGFSVKGELLEAIPLP